MAVIKKKVAIFNDTSVLHHYGCNAVMSNLCTFAVNSNLEPSFFWPVGVDWRPHVTRLKRVLTNYQAIIVNGEGTIHNPRARAKAKILLELPQLASELAIPIYLVNSTIHNLDPDHLKMLLKFNGIFVRDTASKRLLLDANISSSVVPDLSCFSPSLSEEIKIRSNSRILVTGSVVEEKNRILKSFAKKNSFDFKDIYFKKRDILTRVFSRAKSKCVFTPEQKRITAPNRYQDWLPYVKQYELLVTGRFHAVSLSLLTGTPFLAVDSNTPKINNLLLDVFGNTHRIVEIHEMSQICKNQNSKKYDFDAKERDAIKKYLTSGYDSCLSMFAEISANI